MEQKPLLKIDIPSEVLKEAQAQVTLKEMMLKFCEGCGLDEIEKCDLEFPVAAIFHPFHTTWNIFFSKLLDFGGKISVIPGVWWVDGGKRKLIINSSKGRPVTGTLDGIEWIEPVGLRKLLLGL